ncbi:MAG: hypothetical protein J0H92_09830 [Sphingobacteriales bacterium]|nr:hypothetical protein [Sphingobacteriales bacterium]
MKKMLLLTIILLTGRVSLLAQPVSQREKEEIFTRTKNCLAMPIISLKQLSVLSHFWISNGKPESINRLSR